MDTKLKECLSSVIVAGSPLALRSGGVVLEVQRRRAAAEALIGAFDGLGSIGQRSIVAFLAGDAECTMNRLAVWIKGEKCTPSMSAVLSSAQPLSARMCSVAATLGRRGVLFVFKIRSVAQRLIQSLQQADCDEVEQLEQLGWAAIAATLLEGRSQGRQLLGSWDLMTKISWKDLSRDAIKSVQTGRAAGCHLRELSRWLESFSANSSPGVARKQLREHLARLTIQFDKGMQAVFSTQLTAKLSLVSHRRSARALVRFIERREAVHPFQTGKAGKSSLVTAGPSSLRLGGSPGRLCLALRHPYLPMEPLCFVQIALAWALPTGAALRAGNTSHFQANPTTYVQAVTNANRWVDHPTEVQLQRGPQAAVLYSITNAFPRALKGLSLASHLLVVALEALRKRFPALPRVITLSPIPSFRRWLESAFRDDSTARSMFGDAAHTSLAMRSRLRRLAGEASSSVDAADKAQHRDPRDDAVALVRGVLAQSEPPRPDGELGAWFHRQVARWACYYLLFGRRDHSASKAADPVANFHLSNGGSVERVVPAADSSERGWKQSLGAFVNYCYRSTERSGMARTMEVYESMGVVCSPQAAMLVARSSGLPQSRRVKLAQWGTLVAGLSTEELPVVAVRLRGLSQLRVPLVVRPSDHGDTPADGDTCADAAGSTASRSVKMPGVRVWFVVRGSIRLVCPAGHGVPADPVVRAGDAVGLEAAACLAQGLMHDSAEQTGETGGGDSVCPKGIIVASIQADRDGADTCYADVLGVPLLSLANAMRSKRLAYVAPTATLSSQFLRTGSGSTADLGGPSPRLAPTAQAARAARPLGKVLVQHSPVAKL